MMITKRMHEQANNTASIGDVGTSMRWINQLTN